MPPRSTASATLHIGFVAIPVKLYSATSEEPSISFNLLHAKCGSRVKQQYFCPKDGEKVERDDMVKGFEVAKDQYVTFTKEDLEVIEQASSPSIEIVEFVPLVEVDPIHYDKAHHLGPDDGAERAYGLFAAALQRAGRAGLGRFSTRGKQHLVMLRAAGGRLVLQQLHRAEQVRPAGEIPIVAAVVQEPELQLALELIEQRASDMFSPEAYPDQVRERTLSLIAEKVAGKKIVVSPPVDRPAAPLDLIEALKSSLASYIGERRPPKKAKHPARAASGV